jgi:hypothetical protein
MNHQAHRPKPLLETWSWTERNSLLRYAAVLNDSGLEIPVPPKSGNTQDSNQFFVINLATPALIFGV